MSEIGKLKELLLTPISEANIEKILVDTGTVVRDDIRALAPIDSGEYRSSINLSEVKKEGSIYSIKIFTNLNSGWKNIPLGCLLEWGTGIKGEATNTYEHGFPYRQTPWVYYNERYGRWVFTHGNVARPHFIPGLYNNYSYFLDNIRKGFRNYGK